MPNQDELREALRVLAEGAETEMAKGWQHDSVHARWVSTVARSALSASPVASREDEGESGAC